MIPKSTILYPILFNRCPRCRTGKLYDHPILSFTNLFEMPDHCDICQQKFMLEPGFYWGAMYVSYAISGGIMLGGYLALSLVTEMSVWPKFFIMTVIVFILYAWIFRKSRAIWIALHVSFNHQYLN